MRFSFGTRFELGGRAQHEIVEFAASKLVCAESGGLWTRLNDDQQLGMENHQTPFVLA